MLLRGDLGLHALEEEVELSIHVPLLFHGSLDLVSDSFKNSIGHKRHHAPDVVKIG